MTEAAPRSPAQWRTDTTVRAVGAAMIVGFAVRLALLARPIASLDRGFVPDDTYYTLTIARSIAHGHGPTADGTTLTSGFQPLLGFLMVPVYWLTDNLDAALRADLALLVVVDVLIIALLAWIAYRLAGRVAAIVAAVVWALSPVATTLALGGLETSLALFCEVGLVAACIWANDRPSTRRWAVVGVIAGLAVLARVDALLLVGLLALVQLWRGPRRALVPASIAGVITLAPWWGWCTVNLGTPIPTSGSALHRLATYGPFAPHNLARVAGAVSGGPFGNPTAFRKWLDRAPVRGSVLFGVLVAALLAVAFFWLRGALTTRGDHEESDASAAYAAALPVFAAGLLFFYAWFGVWYFNTRYLAPVQIALALSISVIVSRFAPERRRAARVGFLVLAGTVALATGAAVVYDAAMVLGKAPANHVDLDAATGFRATAHRVLRVTPNGSIVAGYQSGALSYFGSGRITVINLDGVVNPDAPPPDDNPATRAYMQRRHVRWLADWAAFLLPLIASHRESGVVLRSHVADSFTQLAYVPYDVLEVTGYRVAR